MLLGVSVVKNQADIVEAMARLNMRYLDHIHFIDNGSTDGTFEILQELSLEFIGLTVFQNPSKGHLQTFLMNNFLTDHAQKFAPTHVIPLDGDEVLCGSSSDFKDECRRSNLPLRLRWRTYVPTLEDDIKLINPIRRQRYRRVFETPQYEKVTVPGRLSSLAQWAAGSHSVLLNGEDLGGRFSESCFIAHFPVRNVEQIAAKALIGHWNLLLRNADRHEGYQWHQIAEKILTSGMLTQDELCEVGHMYAASYRSELIKDPVWPEDISLRYTDLIKTDALCGVARFAEELVSSVSAQNKHVVEHHSTLNPPLKFLDSNSSSCVKLPEQAQVSQFSVGDVSVQMCVTHPNDVIQGEHLRGRFYEQEELNIISRYFVAGDVFFDIGANVGNHVIFCGLFRNQAIDTAAYAA